MRQSMAEEDPVHRRIVSFFALCMLVAACGCSAVPGSAPDIDPVATQMAINTRVSAKKTAGPTLTAEALKTPQPATPETPEATAAPGAGGDLELVMPVPPRDLDSYSLTERIGWDGVAAGGIEVAQQITTSIEYVSEPPAMHMSVTSDAEEMAEAMALVGLEGDTIEFYMLEGSIYMWLFGGWMQMSFDALTMGLGFGEMDFGQGEMDFSSTYTMTQWLQDATYVGQEDVGGQTANHYTLSTDSIDLGSLPLGMEVETVTGDLYTAVEGNYIVHLDMTLEGSNLTMPNQAGETVLAEGRLAYQSSLSSVNEALTIELPADVTESTSPPADIPVPAGAVQVMGATMFGASMFAFFTDAPPEDVAAFYASEMPEFGWKQVEMGEEEPSEAMFSTKYSKDEQTITVEIDGDATFGTSVMLSSGDPDQFFPFAPGQS
jgi:hypothetical protein